MMSPRDESVARLHNIDKIRVVHVIAILTAYYIVVYVIIPAPSDFYFYRAAWNVDAT